MGSSAFTSESGARARRRRGGLAGAATVKRKYGISLQELGARARGEQLRVMHAEYKRYRALYGPLPELDPRDGYPAYILQRDRDRD